MSLDLMYLTSALSDDEIALMRLQKLQAAIAFYIIITNDDRVATFMDKVEDEIAALSRKTTARDRAKQLLERYSHLNVEHSPLALS